MQIIKLQSPTYYALPKHVQLVGRMAILRVQRATTNAFIAIAAWMAISTLAPVSAKLSLAETAAQQQQTQVVRYSNTWAVEMREGAKEADALAQKYGLVNRGQVK